MTTVLDATADPKRVFPYPTERLWFVETPEGILAVYGEHFR